MKQQEAIHRNKWYNPPQRSMILSFLVGFGIVFGIASSLAADTKPKPPESQTLLSRHQINLNDENTWGNQKVIPIGGQEGAVQDLRLAVDLAQRTLTLALTDGTPSGVISTLVSKDLDPSNPTTVHQTFIIADQPHFVKFSIDPSGKVLMDRMSTPLPFYTTGAVPLQIGTAGSDFGFIESRGASVYLGVDQEVITGFNQPNDYIFKPTDPVFTTHALAKVDNQWGGLYSPKGKVVVSATEFFANGQGVGQEVRTTITHKALNITKPFTYKFYTGGTGSFMRAHSYILVNSNYISNLYNEMEVTGGVNDVDGGIVLQGPNTSTIKVTGKITSAARMWVKANVYDVRREHQPILLPVSGNPQGQKVGDFALSYSDPQIVMKGYHYLYCNEVSTNHECNECGSNKHPNRAWQPTIANVPAGKEIGNNYNGDYTSAHNCIKLYDKNPDNFLRFITRNNLEDQTFIID